MQSELIANINTFTALIIGLVLILTDYRGRRSAEKTQQFLFTLMVGFAVATMMSELCYSIAMGVSGEFAYIFCLITNTLYFLFQGAVIGSTYLFFDYTTNRDHAKLRRAGIIFALITAVNAAALAVNMFTGFIFVITPDNIYQDVSVYVPICVGYLFAILILVNVINVRKRIDKNLLILILAAVFPTAVGSTLDLFLVGLKLTWACYFLSMLFCYIFIARAESLKLMETNIKLLDLTQGHLDVAIPYSRKRKDEFDAVSMAIHGMIEQLRVREIRHTQMQAITAAGLRFDLFIKCAESVPQAFKMTLALFRYQYDSVRVTIVYPSQDDFYALISYIGGDGRRVTEEADYFLRHEQVLSLIAGKEFVFLNNFTLKELGADFADANTQIACIAPLIIGDVTKGYIILESGDEETLPVVREEEFLRSVAGELAGWISSFEKSRMTEPKILAGRGGSLPPAAGDADDTAADATADALALLREIDGLEVDAAIAVMGGMDDVYEKTVRLFTRLAPDCIDRMIGLIDTDLNAFAVEIHGIKGSLNNIGASELGVKAAEIESAAKSGDINFCRENWPPYREKLVEFHGKLMSALPERETGERSAGDESALLELLRNAKVAAEDFDAYGAMDIMRGALEYTYGVETDSLIRESVAFLESYDCENAAVIIEKLINAADDGGGYGG